MNNRRALLTQKTSKEYIQEGLVFNLDGTDKQANDNYVWVDKVTGRGFYVLGSGVTSIDNGFSFNGNGMLEGQAFNGFANARTYTVELVLKSKLSSGAWSPIIIFHDWDVTGGDYLGVDLTYAVKNTLGVRFSLRNNYNCYIYDATVANNNIATISVPGFQKPVYINQTLITTTLTTSASGCSNRDYAHIGGRSDYNTSSYVYFIGEIYAIRAYNRTLSEEEILYNQQIDIKKYNIS